MTAATPTDGFDSPDGRTYSEPVTAAMLGEAGAPAASTLLTLLDGMVPLAAIEVSRWSSYRQVMEAERLADILSLADSLTGDAEQPSRRDMETLPPMHLWAGEGKARGYHRGEVLGAVARGLALGALRPGGVTFAGRHWCRAPHGECPAGNVPEAAA